VWVDSTFGETCFGDSFLERDRIFILNEKREDADDDSLTGRVDTKADQSSCLLSSAAANLMNKNNNNEQPGVGVVVDRILFSVVECGKNNQSAGSSLAQYGTIPQY
jgi:hypothetical protein